MTVDEYIAALPKDQQKALEDLRKIIKKAAPKAEELISYQMPSYKHKGLLVHFAAFKDHLSFFPGRKLTTEEAAKFKDFYVKNATIHFTPDKPMPEKLVTEIVKTRVKENETKSKR